MHVDDLYVRRVFTHPEERVLSLPAYYGPQRDGLAYGFNCTITHVLGEQFLSIPVQRSTIVAGPGPSQSSAPSSTCYPYLDYLHGVRNYEAILENYLRQLHDANHNVSWLNIAIAEIEREQPASWRVRIDVYNYVHGTPPLQLNKGISDEVPVFYMGPPQRLWSDD